MLSVDLFENKFVILFMLNQNVDVVLTVCFLHSCFVLFNCSWQYSHSFFCCFILYRGIMFYFIKRLIHGKKSKKELIRLRNEHILRMEILNDRLHELGLTALNKKIYDYEEFEDKMHEVLIAFNKEIDDYEKHEDVMKPVYINEKIINNYENTSLLLFRLDWKK
jgi:hypothetical protein